MNIYTYKTTLGDITITSDKEAITTIKFCNSGHNMCRHDKCILSFADKEFTPSALTNLAADQLEEYFLGKRKVFDLPLRPSGTEFQLSVWDALLKIPYGETRSYKQIAEMIGKPKACRAVGMANNKNPIWIVIPCHRVIGSNGTLVGYGGGIDVKKKLLELEGVL